jgi:hypothetical protein
VGTTMGRSAEWCDKNAGNDGGGGAHTVAYQACCMCGWPIGGATCQSVLQILPHWYTANDPVYYSCIGGEVPWCILDHIPSCPDGIPAECADVYAAQVACLANARGGSAPNGPPGPAP